MSRDRAKDAEQRRRRNTESLAEFLARMTVVWHERQAKLNAAAERQAEVSRRSAAKRKAEDPEGFRAARLEAVRRYEERHPDRIVAKRERDRQTRARLGAALAISKQIVKAEKAAQRAADAARGRAEKAAKRGPGGSLGVRVGQATKRASTALPVAPQTWFSL